MTAEHKEPNYMGIFWWLLGLTILEVAATRLPAPRMVIAVLLVGMALTKAALVAMYFMHLKFEKKVLAAIAVVPLVLCVFLALMLMPDSKENTPMPAGADAAATETAPASEDAGHEGVGH